LTTPEISVGREISHSRDPWLPDHKPYPMLKYPLFSAVMAVETFMEAAQALHPDLVPAGVRNVQFMDMIPCAEGAERHLRTTAKSTGGSTPVVEAILSCRDMSPMGRQLDNWIESYGGEVVMAPSLSNVALPVFGELDSLDVVDIKDGQIQDIYEQYTAQQNRYRVISEITGAAKKGVAGLMVYGDEKDHSSERSAYQYSPYILEALMQLVLFHPLAVGGELAAFLPVGIGSMTFARRSEPGESLVLKARQREALSDTVVWDAVACDGKGDAVMVVDGLSMKRLSG
jgi:hypothetical protein